MNEATWMWLSAVLVGCSSEVEPQPFIKCYEESGPSPELSKEHRFTPSDLLSLNAQIINIQGKCQFNITWILNADASIRYLNASKICLSTGGGSPSCIRCDYTKKFQSQTMLGNQKWQFHYIGYPIEENTVYFIDAYNLPPANIDGDYSERLIELSSPDCEDSVLKYCEHCIEKGSLWYPNITVCYKKSEVEVNFTPSIFCFKYVIRLCKSNPCTDPYDHTVNTTKRNDTRISERISMTNQSSTTFKELIPHFPGCNNDCRRYSRHWRLCTEEPTEGITATDLVGSDTYICILASLFLIVCMIAAVLYFKRKHGGGKRHARKGVSHLALFLRGAAILIRHGQHRPAQALADLQRQAGGRPPAAHLGLLGSSHPPPLPLLHGPAVARQGPGAVRNWVLFPPMQHLPATILVVYSQEVCFQHTVLIFAEFLHECCQSDVIIDVWQKRRIAEMGPVMWLATQKQIADKIVFLIPSRTNPACNSACKRTVESQNGSSECMFTLAFNLFCSDWNNQSSLQKYMVVSFSETNSTKSLPSPLNICPTYFLMKDIDSFCRDLYLLQSPKHSESTKLKCSWRLKMKPKLEV
ncbi:interleukin-17 receptor B isoform X3 [Rhineura floridana]|uniref:interleukin-17 receptor B isoform X3 n=1 Tax=Rhineura floridana TaxID=261503 RepID=UPI002AC82D43|nr:interleukin-17 receptor B isoform X3 [Rhineura floridana]